MSTFGARSREYPSDQYNITSEPRINTDELIRLQCSNSIWSQVILWVEQKKKPVSSEYKLLTSDQKHYMDIYELLLFHNGLLKHSDPNACACLCLCLPTAYLDKALHSIHDSNHAGASCLIQTVQQRFFFPRMTAICLDFINNCPRCQRMVKYKPQRHAHDIVGSPGDKIAIDFVGPLHKTRRGNNAIFTVVDCYTRWFEAWPVNNQTADTTIKHLLNEDIPHHGFPATVHSDNCPAFISKIFTEAMKRFDVRATTTPVYNACSNMVERYHRTTNRRLKALIHEMNREWDELLPSVLLSMRTTTHRTTGYTPFFLFKPRKRSSTSHRRYYRETTVL